MEKPEREKSTGWTRRRGVVGAVTAVLAIVPTLIFKGSAMAESLSAAPGRLASLTQVISELRKNVQLIEVLVDLFTWLTAAVALGLFVPALLFFLQAQSLDAARMRQDFDDSDDEWVAALISYVHLAAWCAGAGFASVLLNGLILSRNVVVNDNVNWALHLLSAAVLGIHFILVLMCDRGRFPYGPCLAYAGMPNVFGPRFWRDMRGEHYWWLIRDRFPPDAWVGPTPQPAAAEQTPQVGDAPQRSLSDENDAEAKRVWNSKVLAAGILVACLVFPGVGAFASRQVTRLELRIVDVQRQVDELDTDFEVDQKLRDRVIEVVENFCTGTVVLPGAGLPDAIREDFEREFIRLGPEVLGCPQDAPSDVDGLVFYQYFEHIKEGRHMVLVTDEVVAALFVPAVAHVEPALAAGHPLAPLGPRRSFDETGDMYIFRDLFTRQCLILFRSEKRSSGQFADYQLFAGKIASAIIDESVERNRPPESIERIETSGTELVAATFDGEEKELSADFASSRCPKIDDLSVFGQIDG